MANPMYRQIAEDLREQIESGHLQPGQQLRTELELRERYAASRNTIRDAIKWLTTLGLVETKPGQGTFVVKKINPYVTTLTADPRQEGEEDIVGPEEGDRYGDEVEAQSRTPESTEPQVESQKANPEVASLLRVDVGSQVISRHQKRSIDGIPWSMQTSFYPRRFVPQGAEKLALAENIKEGAVRYLANTLGLRQVGYRDWVKMRAPNPAEADFFKLASDGRVSMFEITRTAYDGNSQPIRVTVTVYPADRNQFIVNVGEVPDPVHLDDGA
jgi:GntR family transcriptional regulator